MPLTAVRGEIVDVARRLGNAQVVLLLELDPLLSAYSVTASSGRRLHDDLTLPSNTLLIKWLRVNGVFLEVPDPAGFVASLDDADSARLHAYDVGGLLPLVADRCLIGIVALCGLQGSTAEARRSFEIESNKWAATLTTAANMEREARRRESFAKSNRLAMAGQIATGLAHEVRNPLAAIRSTIQLVQDGEVSVDQQRPLLTSALEEIDRASTMLTSLIQEGRIRRLPAGRVDLCSIVADSLGFLQAYTKKQGQTIKFVRPHEPVAIFGNPLELRQVIVNLLLNACQASPRGGVVVVELRTDPRSATIVISDKGVGISPSQMTQVFEPFFTTKADGGGLGLSICRELLETHGGTLKLLSEPNSGTRAVIVIPVNGPNSDC